MTGGPPIVIVTSGGGRTRTRMPLETRRPVTQPPRIFPPRRDYTSLSIKDLLDARDAYHIRLSMLDNVIATAVGRYLIHHRDWYAKNPPDRPRPKGYRLLTPPKTLANTVMRPWSWPAVLVFVRQWESRKDLGEEAVPRRLYLPDGRVIPTCVIEAQPDESLPPPAVGPSHTSNLLGGGYSCLREHQGEQALGTFACLVRKGGTYYALTTRHVTGVENELVRSWVGDEYEVVGKTSNFAVDRQAMSAVFPAWGANRVLLTLDAGLIRIDDVNDWTSQAFGIGEIGELFDATEATITLDLIGSPVRAFGASSGVSEGEIRALFFQYESVAGYEYATDVLIGPRQGPGGKATSRPFTNPGDSGALWFYDPPRESPPGDEDLEDAPPLPGRGIRARRLRPIAMQWGGQRVRLADGTGNAYALATFLSTVCRSLDAEVMRNWSLGHDEYWGKIGHFAVGWKACERVKGALGQLMRANQPRIGFGNSTLEQGAEFRVGRKGFVPLADVPDYAWIAAAGRKSEPIQHFADIDIRDIDGDPPMLDRCVADPAELAASKWKAYFDGFKNKQVGPEEGTLPFRVWQIWEDMVGYVRMKDVLRFVAAAGVLAHYLGDASQPLHCSYLHHGVPPMVTVSGRKYPVPRKSDEFDAFKKTRAAKVHGIYEETMLEVDPAEALKLIDGAIRAGGSGAGTIKTGHDAGMTTIRLMDVSRKRLPPMTIINADDPDLTAKERAKALWGKATIRKATVQCLADSVRVLAALWTSAWTVGGGERISKTKLVAQTEEDLQRVYRRERGFVPSLSLTAMARGGRFEP